MPVNDQCRYQDQEVYARKEYVDIQFAAAKQALTVAALELERRLEGMNEFRAQLTEQATAFLTKVTEQASLFLTKEQYETKHEALIVRLDSIAETLNKRIGLIEQDLLVYRSKSAGAGVVWKVIIAIIGFMATLSILANAIRIWTSH